MFWSTLVVGVGCTATLAYASPEFRGLLQSIKVESELGPVKGLKLLYVALPFVVALASRLLKLHDRISDVLGLRLIIDVDWILIPLASGVGVEVDEARILAFRIRRRDALYKVFYPFASLPDAKIDRQLIRTALDNLAWLWSMVEALFLVVLTTVGLIALGARSLSLVGGSLALVLLLSIWAQWTACRRSSSAEVAAILAEDSRRTSIREYFLSI